MSDNKLLDLSLEFAAVIVDLVDHINIPKSAYMTDQLGRAGTSIGANIHEAQYAQSRKDFISKLEIALKESNETSYWLKLLFKTNRIDEQTHYRAEKLCGNIRRLLIASVRTAKENQKRVYFSPTATLAVVIPLRKAFLFPKVRKQILLMWIRKCLTI